MALSGLTEHSVLMGTFYSVLVHYSNHQLLVAIEQLDVTNVTEERILNYIYFWLKLIAPRTYCCSIGQHSSRFEQKKKNLIQRHYASSLVAQGVKNPALSLWFQLWHGSDLWSGNFCRPQVWPKTKNDLDMWSYIYMCIRIQKEIDT